MDTDTLGPRVVLAPHRSKPKAKGTMPTRMSARLALQNGKVADSASSKPADAVAKPSRVMAGRVTKKKAAVSRADDPKTLSRVGPSSTSNSKKNGAAALPRPVVSKKDPTSSPKAAATRNKDSASMSKPVNAVVEPARTVARGSKEKVDGGEVRLRKFRTQAPQAYAVILERAMEQRFFLIDRVRGGSEKSPCETFTMTGSTGNVYTVKIANQPECNCPYAEKGNQCKHMVWVMVRVLRARGDLQYQLALLDSELREIFESAPRTATPADGEEATETATDGNRKPVEGDCPICFTEFGGEAVVFCKAACGNNFHSVCLKTWAATKRAAQVTVTCPLCRTPWQESESVSAENLKSIANAGEVNDEGYVNVAGELGTSRNRDYSTYHRFWVGQQRRRHGMFMY